MNTWEVLNIVNGNTITIKPNWKWRDGVGHQVVILGYKLSFSGQSTDLADSIAISRLSNTILGKQVVLQNPTKYEGNTLFCEVHLNEVDVSKYFIDFDKEK